MPMRTSAGAPRSMSPPMRPPLESRRRPRSNSIGGRLDARPRRGPQPLSTLRGAADLLARQYEPENQLGDNLQPDPVASGPHLRQLHEDLHRFELVLGLYQLSAIRDPQHS